MTTTPSKSETSVFGRTDWLVASGMTLMVLAVYSLTGAGRIDIIDGQSRYEVARSMLDGVGFHLRDQALPVAVRIAGVDGEDYSFYGPAPSVLALPLLALARAIGGDLNTEMFFFSFTSALLASVCVGAFYLFRRGLGQKPLAAVLWALMLAFATPLWPLATTVFDQGQQATFLLLSVLLGWQAAVRRSVALSLAAGLVGGTLVLFQESLGILLPFLGLVTLEGASWSSWRPLAILRVREIRTRYLPFALGCVPPVLVWMLYNSIRFGKPFDSGKSSIIGHPPLWGNPLSGFLGLMFSPGKSVFLFFPTVILAFFALRSLWRRYPMLSASIVSTAVVQLGLSSSLTFWGSDWAWGPRYLMVLAPLLMLPVGLDLPVTWQRHLRSGVLTLGVLVQLLAVSADHQRFFLEHRLQAFFWYFTPEVYWQESQFLARPHEVWSVFTEPFPRPPVAFSPGPYAPELPTYTPFGTNAAISDQWMQHFAMFYVPRPWPLWVPGVPEQIRPINPAAMSVACLIIGCLGVFLLGLGLRREEATPGEASALHEAG